MLGTCFGFSGGGGGRGVTSTHNKRGCAILIKKVAQLTGNLPKIETQKSWNPKRQAFLLHEKTYHPNQKVPDINFTV